MLRYINNKLKPAIPANFLYTHDSCKGMPRKANCILNIYIIIIIDLIILVIKFFKEIIKIKVFISKD